MRKFINCDVLAVLGKIMEHNTQSWQTDLEIDKEILTKAAQENDRHDKRFLWLSRPCGTLCVKEKDAYLRNTSSHNSWRYYHEQTNDRIAAYAVELDELKDGVVKGDIYELDYSACVKDIRDKAVAIGNVQLTCGNDNFVLPYSSNWFDLLPLHKADHEAALAMARANRLTERYANWDLEKLKLEYGYDGTDAYSVYQLKPCMEEFRFEPYYRIEKSGHNLTVEDYDMIYTDKRNGETLDDIYIRFNIDHPKDYVGYSLSVSDVIVLVENGERTAYFVDSVGFKKLPDFFSDAIGMQAKKQMQM